MFNIKKLFSKNKIKSINKEAEEEKLYLLHKNRIKNFINRKNCYIEGYDYKQLQTKDELIFGSVITKSEFKYFKYIKKDMLVEFVCDDFDNVFKVINELLKNNIMNIKIFLYDTKFKNKFDEYIKNKNLDDIFNAVKIQNWYSVVNLKDYINSEKVLNNIIKPALDLSPLEKFIYAYNITKHFKEYKIDENNPRNCRDLYKVLNNEYMVCTGFVLLLSDLLNKLGINSKFLNLDVYSEKSTDGHIRNYVYLKDDKYDIDGFYLSDATYDNDLIQDNYNHMLFTDRKNESSLYLECLTEQILFNSNSMFEFNRNYDICMKRLNKNNNDLLKYLLNTIEKLDYKFIADLRKKYKNINGKITLNVKENNYDNILKLKNELGRYIVSKVNKEIDKVKIKNAIRVIYDKFYGFSDKNKMDEYLEKVFEYNEERESQVFPLLEKNKTYVKKL